MKINISHTSINSLKAKFLVLPIITINDSSLKQLDQLFSKQISHTIKDQKFTPKPGSKIDLTVAQLETKKKNSPELTKIRISVLSSEAFKAQANVLDEWRKFAGGILEAAKREKSSSVTICLHSIETKYLARIIPGLVEGIKLASYEYNKFKAKNSENNLPKEIILALNSKIQSSLRQTITNSIIVSEATMFARNLVNCPPSKMTPTDLVKEARLIAAKSRNHIKVKIYNKQQLKKMKAGALLAVAQGSAVSPFLIHLSYIPKKSSRNAKRIVLVGKGVTFDSGGLSIKPGQSMMEMKCDMAGAAAVLSTIKAISEMKPSMDFKDELHVIIPTCDNMINSLSVKPGDVAIAINGKSIEILNTDAEGRLILADAFCYAAKLKPDLMIDLATLTGACIAALGSDYAGLFSNNEKLSKAIQEAANFSGELVWPLPLAKEYRECINSSVADIRNIGSPGPGAITAALFLAEFVAKDLPWAHLDIAGPAFVSKGNEYIKKGGTGYGVRLLIHLLQNIKSSL